MNQRKSRTYDKEFKLNAIRLSLDSGRGHKELSEELGIPQPERKPPITPYCLH